MLQIRAMTTISSPADSLGLIKALGLVNPVLVGHSMGGMTAALVASWNPKQLRRLILVDPTFLTPHFQQEVYKSGLAAQHREILNQPREDFLAQRCARKSHRSRELIELLAEARLQTSIHAFDVLIPPNPDYVQLVKKLSIPSLLIFGDKSPVISVEMATELSELNQHLQVSMIEEAGHGVPYDQPESLAAVVKTFLRCA